MDTIQKKLPIGIEDFEKLRENGFYYVDKTALIRDLLHNPAEVTLFTHPRCFQNYWKGKWKNPFSSAVWN